jgi:hypothetical protein
MRTLLAAVALLLLVAPGCGDDNTSGSTDMAVKDLSMGGGNVDMSKYLCQNAFACGSLCLAKPDQVACATACGAGLNTVSGPKFLGLVQCLFAHCSVDGSDITQMCAVGTITTTDMGKGPCVDALAACQGDTGK